MATTKPLPAIANSHRPHYSISRQQWKNPTPSEIGCREQDERLMRWALFQTYGVDLLENDAQVDHTPLQTLPERLAALLITQSADQGGAIEGLRLQTIADFLGTYRETVGAILRAFARQDMVELGRGRIDILDLPALRDLAGIYEWEQFGGQGKERHVQFHLLGAQ